MSFNFDQVYKLTYLINGKEDRAVVAMGVREASAPLPGGKVGLRLAYVVNSWTHPLRKAVGYVEQQDGQAIYFRQTDSPPEVISVLLFEPLTTQNWPSLAQDVAGREEIPTDSDDALCQFFFHAFVPADIWDDLPPQED